MTSLVTAHTADLDAGTLVAARALLDAVFGEQMTDEDWEHALGGIHALVWDGDELVGHASVVQRRLLHGGRTLRCGYVEGVAVRADRQRQGIGAQMMAALQHVIRRAYDLGALGATEGAVHLYTGQGWQQWRGPTSALTPDGVRRTPDEDDGVWVYAVDAPLDLSGEITCDWREGEVW